MPTDHKEHIIYCDANPKTLCAVIDGKEYTRETGVKKFFTSEFEYWAVLYALEIIESDSKATIYSDNTVVVAHLNSDYEVEHEKEPYHFKIKKLVGEKRILAIFRWIPRDLNLAGWVLG